MKRKLVLLCDRSLAEGDPRLRRSARLYFELAKTYDITAITRVAGGVPVQDAVLGAGFIERRIARTPAEVQWHEIARARYGADGGDDAMYFERVIALNPEFVSAVRENAATAAALIVIRPYAYSVARALFRGPILYDALHVEYVSRAAQKPHAPNRVDILEKVARVERQCARESHAIFAGSPADAALIGGLYDVDAARICTVAAAFDEHAAPVLNVAERAARKVQTSLRDRPTVLFAGSGTPENMADVIALLAVAAASPDVSFLVLGRVGEIVPAMAYPTNVAFTGYVDDATFHTLMAAADVFLVAGEQPRTRAKIVDAIGHGIPLVLSASAANGIFTDGVDAEVAPVAALAQRIRDVLASPQRAERNARGAIETAKRRFAIRDSAAHVLTRLDEVRSMAAPI